MIKDVIRISKTLIYDEPFYGSVLLSLQKTIDDKTKTASVGLSGILYRLKVNPDFWKSLSDNHKKGLLIHELGHIVNFHLSDYDHMKDHYRANVAMDIYINQTIKDNLLPPGGCTPEKYEVPKNLSTNEYYKLLEDEENQNETYKNGKEAFDKGEDSCKDADGNPMQVPKHDWEEIKQESDAVQTMAAKSNEKLLKNVVDSIKNSNPGSIPGGLEQTLNEKLTIKPPKFNWKGFIRRFVGTSSKTWTYKSKRKRSKRFEGMPGLKEKSFSKILVAIDTSLSVSIPDLNEFRGELIHLYKTGHDIEIILCDTMINNQFKFKPSKEFIVKGRGGKFCATLYSDIQ